MLLRSELVRVSTYAATLLRTSRLPREVWALVVSYASLVVDPLLARPLLRRATPRTIIWVFPVVTDGSYVTVRGAPDTNYLELYRVKGGRLQTYRDTRQDRFVVHLLRSLEREHLVPVQPTLRLTYAGVCAALASQADGWILSRRKYELQYSRTGTK